MHINAVNKARYKVTHKPDGLVYNRTSVMFDIADGRYQSNLSYNTREITFVLELDYNGTPYAFATDVQNITITGMQIGENL